MCVYKLQHGRRHLINVCRVHIKLRYLCPLPNEWYFLLTLHNLSYVHVDIY
jgi:hypothetical protein